MSDETKKLGTASALSIGIGGMVGGGIFAVTGLTVQLTRGAAPLAFVVSGVVALLTSYSYLQLTLRYPSPGGTVEFLNRGFGSGVITGAANILLCFSYVVLLSVYAYAFGSYAASFFPEPVRATALHTLITGVVVGLAALNYFGADLVVRSENFFNAVKMLLLAVFVVVGLCTPMEWGRAAPDNFVAPLSLVSGAMVIFLNYEGFELIANAACDIKDPKRSLPFAYVGGVLIVMACYVLIALVVIGHMSFAEVAKTSDYALSAAAGRFMGRPGYVMVAVAAILATSSAINATFYSSGRLTYIIAKSGELPSELERSVHGQPLEGMLLFAGLTLVIANFVPLDAIATMGSAGFLLIFLAVNLANVRLADSTESRSWLSLLGAAACAVALVIVCAETEENPASRWHLWILVGMILASLLIEVVYRSLTGRSIHLGHGRHARHRHVKRD
ncbi:MAG: APC family permease [Planctomycetales bacterium]|nr:APC family permease [Planctomycetales bacterium]